MIERAPAKINLCLFLGPARASDGRHELVTVFEPLALHDTVRLEPSGSGRDEVVCPGVEGPNLAARALAEFRARTGWDGAPVRLVIDKRIPVAGGMAGGSADAAAALRLAQRASGLGDDALLVDIAAGLGADVPAQIRPRRLLGTGAGEVLEPLPAPAEPYGVLVLPSAAQLPTAEVFREADRLGLGRTHAELDAARDRVRVLARGGDALTDLPVVNDLEPAARSLLPEIGEALDAARATGAVHALLSGSGPTVLGLFRTVRDAERAAADLHRRRPLPLVTEPLTTH